MKKVIFVLVLLGVALLIIFLAKSPSGTGTIKLLTPDTSVVITFNRFLSNSHATQLTQDRSEIQATAGTYSTHSIVLKKKDGPDTWQIKAFDNLGELEKITVRKDQITELSPGPPLVLKTIVQQQGSTVSVGLDIVGSAGEHYRPDARKNNSQLPPPKLKIVNEKGETVASGKFAYG